MTTKPKLKAVQVPWTVSYSVSAIRMTVREDSETIVTFVANLLPKTLVKPFRWQDEGFIEVKFGGVCTRANHNFSDDSAIDCSKYDWTLIYPPDLLATMDEYHHIIDMQNWNKLDNVWLESWVESGICGDPQMYEVLGSDWLRSMNVPSSYSHFMILGHDMHIEILTESWEWKLLKQI